MMCSAFDDRNGGGRVCGEECVEHFDDLEAEAELKREAMRAAICWGGAVILLIATIVASYYYPGVWFVGWLR
jgi:hypothetical protein